MATTLYNAAYFAGMVDVEHKEHSFYISRYPAGREATVFEGAIDLKFRNDNPTGVLIQTAWTPDVDHRAAVRDQALRGHLDAGAADQPDRARRRSPSRPVSRACQSNGAPGFTVTDTRTLREISTGEVRTETRTVKYNPSPIVELRGRRDRSGRVTASAGRLARTGIAALP